MPAPRAVMTGLELVVAVYLVGPGLLHVQHLAPQGEDGLEAGVPALGGGAAGGVALDDIDLGELRVVLVAVPQLVRHGGAAQGASCGGWTPGPCGRPPGPGWPSGPYPEWPGPPRGSPPDRSPAFRRQCRSPGCGSRLLPSLALVWPSNWASVSLTEMTHGEALPAVLAGDLLLVLQHA